MDAQALLRRALYEWYYLRGRPRWDTGITPPEVVDLVERQHFPPGRALDIGCGTGTNVLYLARHGFDVTGFDYVPRVVTQARAKLRAAGVKARVEIADVLAPQALDAVDLVLDIGCLHNFAAEDRARYAANLERWTHPGSRYLLYAFYPRVSGMRRFGIAPAEVESTFAPAFRLISSTADPAGAEQDSAWYQLERK